MITVLVVIMLLVMRLVMDKRAAGHLVIVKIAITACIAEIEPAKIVSKRK